MQIHVYSLSQENSSSNQIVQVETRLISPTWIKYLPKATLLQHATKDSLNDDRMKAMPDTMIYSYSQKRKCPRTLLVPSPTLLLGAS